MLSPLNFSDWKQSLPIWVFTSLLGVLPFMGTLSPRILGLLPAIVGLLMTLAFIVYEKKRPALQKDYALIAVLVSLIAGLSAFWSLDASFAIERSFKVFAVLLGGALLCSALAQGRFINGRLLGRLLSAAFLAGALLYILDLYFDGPVYRILHGWEQRELNFSLMNRSAISVVFFAFPALYALKDAGYSPLLTKILKGALALVLALIVFGTQSQSAQVALVAGLFVWLAFPYTKALAWHALNLLICALIVGAPWLAQFLYNTVAAKVHTAPWLSSAYAADRLEIWDFVARKALESPIYGFGIEATRHIEKFDTQKLYTPHDHVLHPHNMALQIWIEFGALGVAGLCALVTYMLYVMRKLPVYHARLALSLFLMALFVSNTAYGVWQGWWLGLFTVLIALCAHFYCAHRQREAS